MTRAARTALLVLTMAAAGCGGGGGNLPTSVPGSLPSSLPSTHTTPSLPALSSTPTTPTLSTSTSTPTTSTAPTVTTPVTGATSTETTTAIVTATGSTSGPSSGSSTPWGWIAVAAALVVAAVLIGGWALGRRGAARKNWRAQALQASIDGTALHDGALAELIGATSANHAERWSAIATDAGELSASLQRLEVRHPMPRPRAPCRRRARRSPSSAPRSRSPVPPHPGYPSTRRPPGRCEHGSTGCRRPWSTCGATPDRTFAGK